MGKYQDKRMNIMVNKIGLSEKDAEWCLSKHKKYSIWLANQFKHTNIREYEQQVNDILDWKREFQNVNLNDINFGQALNMVTEYRKSLFVDTSNGLKNTNVVLDLGDYKWVQLLTREDCTEEGSAMKHCIGGGGHSGRIERGGSIAFSLRDKYNRPHITIEAYADGRRIFEFKGSSNQTPKKKYMEYFYALQEKYQFSTVTDGMALHGFKQMPNLVEKISDKFHDFFDFNFKISMGLIPFKEDGYYMSDIVVNSPGLEKPMQLGTKAHFYSKVDLRSNEITLGDDIVIGGDLHVHCNKLNLGKNIKVGGNIYITTSTKKEANRLNKLKGKNIECFGKFVAEKEVKK